MPISMPAYQLKLDLDLPEEESNAALSAEDVCIREEMARQALENGDGWPQNSDGQKEAPFWWDRYVFLRIGRWPFRVAALIAWLGTPRKYRWPKTQDELANLLGMSSDRQFTVWRAKNPAINTMVQEFWKHEAIDHLPDTMNAMFAVAAQENYKGNRDRELHLKVAEILKDRSEINLSAGSGDVDELLKTIPLPKLLEYLGITTPEKIDEVKAKYAQDRADQLKAEEEAKNAE